MNSIVQPEPLHAAAQQRTLIQNQAFQAAVNDEPLINSLNILARLVKLELGNEVRTAFYLAYPDGKRLHAVDGAGDMASSYTGPLNGFPVSHDSFCSGYAIATGRPVHTPDVFQSPLWQPYLPMATAHGFRAASSYPILTRQGKAIGSLALYFPDIHQATAQEKALANTINRAAAIILSQDTQTHEHTRAEQALRQSQEKYRTLFETIDEGYAFCQLVRDQTGRATDYRILELNSAFEQQIGAQHADFPGRTAREFFAGYDGWWIDTYARVVDTNQAEHFEHRLANTGRWYAISAYPHGGDHFAILFNDITERKLREQEQAFLLTLGDKLRALTDPVSIEKEVTQSLRAHFETGWCYYVEWDETAKRGLVRCDAAGEALASLVGKHDVSDVPEFLALLKANPLLDVSDYEHYERLAPALRHRYTALGFGSMLVATLVKQERLVASLLIGDTTERRWSTQEEALLMQVAERTWAAIERAKAEEDLRQADRRKDEFLAMLAHELRNPMATIRSGLQILRLVDAKDELSSNTVAMMNRQTDHLVRMVDDLLDVSRISQGKIELKAAPVDLVGLISEATNSVLESFVGQGKRLQVELPSTPIYVHGDPTRLAQVVTNLLTNGARYTGEQGHVWVRLIHRQQEAWLEVRDNGIGLAPDQLTAIFELFVQVDNSVARSKGGLGVGLTLVKRLVALHGGRVEAQSAGVGKGSTFRVYLPTLVTAPEAPQVLAEQPVEQAAPPRILIIDDNADAGVLLAMLLKTKGYEVHVRQNGRAGIEAVQALSPAAVLMDIGMPDLDGYATCQLLRGQPWGLRCRSLP